MHFIATFYVALALRQLGTRLILVVAFCAVMSLPPYVQSASHVLAESPAELTIAAGFYFFVRYLTARSTCSLTSTALFFSYSALTRPANAIVMLFSVFMSGLTDILLFRGPARHWLRRWAHLLLAATAPMLTLVAYSAANWCHHGLFVPTSLAGYNLSTRVIRVIHLAPDKNLAPVVAKHRDLALSSHKNHLWAARYAEAEIRAATGMKPSEISARLGAISIGLILSYPVEYLKAVGEAIVYISTPYLVPYNVFDCFHPHFGKLWVLLHFAMAFGFGATAAVIFALGISGSASTIVGRDIVGVSNRDKVAAVTFAVGVVMAVVGLACALDIGEPRQRSFTDVVAWFVCFYAVEAWLRLRGRGDRTHG
jgi:hypothetical protein